MFDLPTVPTDSKVLALRREAEAAEALRYLEWASSLFDRCQSPIEQLFLAAMLLDYPGDIGWVLGDYKPDREIHFTGHYGHGHVQAQIGLYRADFLFAAYDNRLIVVECDGHEFHERTKDQARKDRSRDRWMTQNGYSVYRFTGSELYADPSACAMQIAEVVGA